VNISVSTKTCPRCGNSIDPQARTCQECGIDLALATILVAEESLTGLAPYSSSTPISPEILVPRLGEILLEKGVISPADLDKALERHKQFAESGQPRLIGHILLELGMVNRETLDQVVTEQIFQLQTALHQANRTLEQRVQERTLDLQSALEKLSELNQLKSNFISNISHELRTPLTHIKGYLSMLADGSLGPLSQEQADALGVLLRSEERLEKLIEDMLLFSLAARGEFTLHKELVNIKDIIRVSLSRVEKFATSRKIKLETFLPSELPLILVDPEKVSWAIIQLLENAIKFTPLGGWVGIEAGSEDNQVWVGVRDTGIGIQPERMEEIFEPFHQLDGSATRHYGGTGLGLALVRRIIEAHGGVIKVDSREGQGSHFQIYLTVAKDGYAQ